MKFTTRKWIQVSLVLWLLQYIYCDCLLPELDFPNGEVKLPHLVEENGTFAEELSGIQFTCFDGYLRIGEEYIHCVYGNWTDSVPFCAGLICTLPPEVNNATYVTYQVGIKSLPNAVAVGSLVVYKCNRGFEFENANASTVQCVLNTRSDMALWKGELPVCKETFSCPDPGISNHGERSGQCCLVDDALQFACYSGYELVGYREIHCLPSGVWSSDRPLCRPREEVYCEPPPMIPHGMVTSKKSGDYFMAGELVLIVCDPGYRVIGNSYSVCLGERFWQKAFGICEEIFCNVPQPIENGTIPELEESNKTIFPYNFEIHYICDQGFRLFHGASWRKCGKRGWSGKTPRCEVLRCPSGDRSGTNYSVGTKIRISCPPQYELLGSSDKRCMTNGQWSGEISRCNIRSDYCPDPGTPFYGSKNKTRYEIEDRVLFQCDPNHILLGSEIRECLPNKTWSGKETKCLSYYDFDDEVEVSNILKTKVIDFAFQINEQQKYNEMVRSAGNENQTLKVIYPGRIILYFAFDVSSSFRFTKESIEFAKAVVRKIGISKNGARAAALTFGSEVNSLFLPMTFSTTELVLDALANVNVTGGGTSSSSVLRAVRLYQNIAVEEWFPGENTKTLLFILTDGKANMGGMLSREANLLKADGVEIFCIGITGNINNKILFDIASSAKYGIDQRDRPNVFILQNYKTLAWLAQDVTKITEDYVQCGLGVETVLHAGREVKRWPWMAAIYTKEGNDVDPQWTFQRGGSVIHSRFILTSAYSVYKGKGRRRDRSEIFVKLGLVVLSNTSHLQGFEVRKIIVHDEYQYLESRDYNIALLELKEPIQYNPYIRPICLTPKGYLYQPHSIVWSTGWSENKTRNKGDNSKAVIGQTLREILQPIQTRETCLKSLTGKNTQIYRAEFTARMFCTGDGQGGQDSCKGDGGGPVMQFNMNKDGHPSWIQLGIISFGRGCGLKNEYTFHTNLQELMPWVENEIEKALKFSN